MWANRTMTVYIHTSKSCDAFAAVDITNRFSCGLPSTRHSFLIPMFAFVHLNHLKRNQVTTGHLAINGKKIVRMTPAELIALLDKFRLEYSNAQNRADPQRPFLRQPCPPEGQMIRSTFTDKPTRRKSAFAAKLSDLFDYLAELT
jgi:hypothetical protein